MKDLQIQLNIAMAPMEGVTTAVYRRVYQKHFDGVDRFFTPFLSVKGLKRFAQRENREILPFQANLVPQLLTNDSENFVRAARELQEIGYREVNLNAGCPVATVFTKHKGAGMLSDPEGLDRFLDGVFSAADLPEISVKTRVGVFGADEAGELAEVYARYPLSELIIHPRVRKDFYQNRPDSEAFRIMKEAVRCPVCWNGDLNTPEDVCVLQGLFPDVDRIMTGRGCIADPSLPRQIRGGKRAEAKEIKAFLDDLQEAYRSVMSGERDVLFKLKEIWSYLERNFPDHPAEIRKLKKAKNLSEYEAAADELLAFWKVS